MNPRTHRLPADETEQRARRFIWIFRANLYSILAILFVFGGPVTRALAVAAAVFAFFGDVDGGVRHALRVVGLGLAIWLAPGCGVPLGDWLGAQFNVPTLVSRGLGIVIAGLGIIIGFGLFARLLHSLTHRRKRLGVLNRIAGALLGASEGALLVAIVCWTLAAFEEPIRLLRYQLDDSAAAPRSSTVWLVHKLDSCNAAIQRDMTGQLLTRVNPVAELPAVQTARHVVEVATDREAFAALARTEELERFARLPALQRHIEAFQNDPKLRAALENHDLAIILQSDQLFNMVNDRELYDTLAAHQAELRDALRGFDVDAAKRSAQQADAGTRARAQQHAAKARTKLGRY